MNDELRVRIKYALKFAIKGLVPLALATSISIASENTNSIRVDLESEDCLSSNFHGSPMPRQSDNYSGRRIVQHQAEKEGLIRYEFRITRPAKYSLWVRERPRRWNASSPVRWKVDEKPWSRVGQGTGLPEQHAAGQWGDVLQWTHFGDIALDAGVHVLTIQTEPRRGGGGHVLALDKLVFINGGFNSRQETIDILTANGRLPVDPEAKGVPEGWFALPVEIDSFEPSFLDGILPLKGPTGAHGRLTVQDDQFVFEDGTAARFWGVSGPATPEKADAEYFARRARRLGINLVRLHTLDGELIDPNSPFTGAKGVDPVLLDKFDYFIAKLGEQGVYVLVDCLYDWVGGKLKQADGIPDGEKFAPRNRMPWFYDERLQERNKEMLRLLLNRVNPYTGIKNGDDPTVAMLTVVNENGVFFYSADIMPPHVRMLRQKQWNAWLKQRYGTDAELRSAWGWLADGESLGDGSVALASLHDLCATNGKALQQSNRTRFRDAAMFLAEVQTDFFASVRNFVREELGFPILVNGSGWQGVGWLDQMDEYTNCRDMDYIARHGYWDHPRHGWGPSACYHHRHMLETLPHDSLVEYFASRRPSHIPFTITEWNQCSPNDQLIEAVPIMACYGALQDWSMLLHYRMDFPDWLLASDIAFNPESPTMLYQYPIAAYAFLHSYIKPGDIVWRNTIPDVFDIDRIKGKETEYTLKPEHPAGYLSVGEHALVGRCENVYGDEESFQADITPFRSQDGAMIRSITGELQWRGGASPLLTVNAAKMRGFAGRVDRDVIELGGLRIHVTPGTHASIFVIALDNRSLEESKSMLLSIVGPVSLVDRGALVKAEQVGRDGGPLYKIQPQGRLPIMMKEVAGFIEFDKSVQRACQLDVSGRPKANAGVEEQGRRLPFSNRGSIWYAISR